jgi:hypothetical protein
MAWTTKTLYPAEKWLPIHVAPEPWQVISSPPSMELPKPPPGVPVYWWLHPKKDWPYSVPWAKKEFGVLPPMQTWMRENHTHHFPPLGVIKVRMYGQSEQQIPEGQQIAFQKIRIHMRHLSPDEVKLKMMSTPFGVRYYARGKAWDKYSGGSEYKEINEKPTEEPDT